MYLNVLIACEESQRVCIAFREYGCTAFSCDLQNPSGGHPEWHILGDALRAAQGGCVQTMDGIRHYVGRWDLIIAHPPCTYLSNAGACRLYPQKGHLDLERLSLGMRAKDFFLAFLGADCDRIAIENPIPSSVYGLPPYTQIIEPYEYGEPYTKKTCLWLRGLPPLVPTSRIWRYDPAVRPFVSCGTSRNKGNPEKAGVSRSGGAAKVRSKTFNGIARAMAAQWGCMPEYEYQLTLF